MFYPSVAPPDPLPPPTHQTPDSPSQPGLGSSGRRVSRVGVLRPPSQPGLGFAGSAGFMARELLDLSVSGFAEFRICGSGFAEFRCFGVRRLPVPRSAGCRFRGPPATGSEVRRLPDPGQPVPWLGSLSSPLRWIVRKKDPSTEVLGSLVFFGFYWFLCGVLWRYCFHEAGFNASLRWDVGSSDDLSRLK